MKHLFVAAVIASAVHPLLRADENLLPVVSGSFAKRVYVTTLILRNRGSESAACTFTHGTLEARTTLVAGETREHENFGGDRGIAGIVRAECRGDVALAVRIQQSDGAGFSGGRVYRALRPVTAAPSTSSGFVLLAEPDGKAVTVTIRPASAQSTGLKEIHLSAFQIRAVELQPCDFGGTVSIDAHGARLFAAFEDQSPEFSRLGFLKRRYAAPSSGDQSAVTSASPARLLTLSSFKAAPFREPVTGLIYMRDRWFDPRTGMFMTPDRRGYADSSNPYAYCGGDPVNCSDPTGEAALVTTTGWLVATDNRGVPGGTMRRFSPEEIAKDPRAVRDFIGKHSGITALQADEVMAQLGYGHLFGGSKLAAAQHGVLSAAPMVDAAGTGLQVISGFTPIGGSAQLIQAVATEGATKTNVVIAGLTLAGLGATDDLARLGSLRPASGPQKLLASSDTVANAGGVIRSFVTQTEEVYYRVYTANSRGAFLTKTRPSNRAMAVEGLALPPGNTALYIQEVRVPAGVRMQRSRAVAAFGHRGGMEQFQLLDQIPVENFGAGVPFH